MRKCGATIRRSICSSVLLASAKTTQFVAAFARAHLDAADDAVGAGRGGDLNAVAVAALMVEHGGEIDRRRVTTNAHRVHSPRRRTGRNNHEAQRQQREAPDQTQCRFSALRCHRSVFRQ